MGRGTAGEIHRSRQPVRPHATDCIALTARPCEAWFRKIYAWVTPASPLA
jgi:hypothetical protein